jgi:diaminohydroxyphosphoribosylaminopyrimidine deaminase / 5-amino-6-(5-phosphoribosylamino)uracil reductase
VKLAVKPGNSRPAVKVRDSCVFRTDPVKSRDRQYSLDRRRNDRQRCLNFVFYPVAPKICFWGFFMTNGEDIKFMQRAIELSKKGYGFVNPNPLVGSVLVKNGKIIGEGWHENFGGAHAEINAIKTALTSARGATLYVTLEPCNHFGKTPPCTEKIIKEGISRVVIGMTDPNRLVNGRGIDRLRQSGIEVEVGVLDHTVRKINEIYFKFIQTSIPFCALKTAMTLDGKIATYTGQSKWISNRKSRQWVHELRHRYLSVMVGVNTVIADNPSLTNRSGHMLKKNPLRIVVDSSGRIPMKAKVLDTKVAKTLVAITSKAPSSVRKELGQKGVETIVCPENDGKVDLTFLVRKLGELGIDSILLEGGGILNFSALQSGIIDKIYSFISPKLIGGDSAFTPVGGIGFENIKDAVTLNIYNIHRFNEDLMIEAYINKH